MGLLLLVDNDDLVAILNTGNRFLLLVEGEPPLVVFTKLNEILVRFAAIVVVLAPFVAIVKGFVFIAVVAAVLVPFVVAASVVVFIAVVGTRLVSSLVVGAVLDDFIMDVGAVVGIVASVVVICVSVVGSVDTTIK